MNDKARKVFQGPEVQGPGLRRTLHHCMTLSYLAAKTHSVVNILVSVATFHADKCKCNHRKAYFLNVSSNS